MSRPAWRIMSEELKPCPFCGGEVTRTVEKSYRYVSCENYDCFAVVEAGALSGSEEEAIKMWNTRKGEDERIAQAVAAERARCLEILCYPRKHFSAAYPDWMVWLIELDIRNGVEQPKRGE